MPDKYKFRIPIDFQIEIAGESNPDFREKLREECIAVLHTMMRAAPNEKLFDYDVEVEGTSMRMSVRTGFMGTAHAPNRFRDKNTAPWYHIAMELHQRSKHEYDPAWNRVPKAIVRKADVPYPIGRWARAMMSWIDRNRFIQFRQMELLEYWSKLYKTKAKPPPKTPPIKRKKPNRSAIHKRVGPPIPMVTYVAPPPPRSSKPSDIPF